MNEPWTRQDNEGEKAFEAFQIYRDLASDRSTAKVAKTLGKSTALTNRWSAEHGWVRRAAAYDRHLDSERRRERERANRDMERRQATQLAAASQALTQPVRAFLERIQRVREGGGDPFGGVSTVELGRFAAMAIRHLPSLVESERLVAGLSTENLNADAPASVDEARRRAEEMSRGQLEEYLLGVDDGRREALRRMGVEDDEAVGGDA